MEGAGVDIRESKSGGCGVEAAGGGINVEVKNLSRRGGAHRKNGVKGQKTQGDIKSNRGFRGRGTKGLKACEARQEAFPRRRVLQ